MLTVDLATVRLCAVAGRLPRLLLVALSGLIDNLAQLAFSQVEVKLKYIEAITMFFFSIVCFLLQCGL